MSIRIFVGRHTRRFLVALTFASAGIPSIAQAYLSQQDSAAPTTVAAADKPSATPSPSPSFDGRWAVSTSRGCLTSGASIATVSHNRIRGPGYAGAIADDGSVHSVGHYGLITVVSSGHASETEGAGTFRESDGCSGTWTSHKI